MKRSYVIRGSKIVPTAVVPSINTFLNGYSNFKIHPKLFQVEDSVQVFCRIALGKNQLRDFSMCSIMLVL